MWAKTGDALHGENDLNSVYHSLIHQLFQNPARVQTKCPLTPHIPQVQVMSLEFQDEWGRGGGSRQEGHQDNIVFCLEEVYDTAREKDSNTSKNSKQNFM